MTEPGVISRFERNAALVIVGTSVANVSSYGYHVLVSRHLGPTSYGATAAVLGIGVVAAIPSAAIQYSVARRVAESDEAEGLRATRGALKLGFIVGAVAAIAMVLASPALARFLKTGEAPILWAAAWMIPMGVGPAVMGRLQGQRRFAAMTLCFAVNGLGRIGGAAVVVVVGLGVSGAVAAMVASAVASTVIAFLYCGSAARPGTIPTGLLPEVARTALPLAAFSAIVGMDVVLARHYLPPTQSGYYAAASVVGKIVLWAPAAVAATAFPEFASPSGGDRVLARAVRLAGAICLVAVVVTVLGEDLLITTVFGDRFGPAADVVVLVALAMSAMAILHLVTMWALARRVYVVGPVLLVGAVGMATLIATFNGSPRVIGFDLLVGVPVLLAVVWTVVARARPDVGRQ